MNGVECVWRKMEAEWVWASEAVRNEKRKMKKKMVAERNEKRRVDVGWKMAGN